MYKCVVIIGLACLITACSDSDKPQKVEQDHVWKEQTDMINKATDVEQLLKDSAAIQQQSLDEYTQ